MTKDRPNTAWSKFGKKTEKSKMSKMNCHDCDSTIFGYRTVISRHSEGVFEMSENQNGGLAMAWSIYAIRFEERSAEEAKWPICRKCLLIGYRI